MALLQISEPGQSPDPHQRRIAVGIDLGTTHSLVAAIRHGVPECLPDSAGRVILPSAVRYLEGGGRAIGASALAAQAEDPLNTLVSVKRFIGRSLADIAGAAELPYHFVDQPGMVAIETRAGIKSPVEVSAEILATLRQRAEDTAAIHGGRQDELRIGGWAITDVKLQVDLYPRAVRAVTRGGACRRAAVFSAGLVYSGIGQWRQYRQQSAWPAYRTVYANPASTRTAD